MTGWTAFIDGLLAEVILSCKTNIRRSVHTSRYHLIVTLSLVDRGDWRDTLSMWPSARNPYRSCWNRQNSLKLFRPQPMDSRTTAGILIMSVQTKLLKMISELVSPWWGGKQLTFRMKAFHRKDVLRSGFMQDCYTRAIQILHCENLSTM